MVLVGSSISARSRWSRISTSVIQEQAQKMKKNESFSTITGGLLDHLFFPFVRWFNKSLIPFFSSLTTIHRKFFEERMSCSVGVNLDQPSFHQIKLFASLLPRSKARLLRPFSCVDRKLRLTCSLDVQLTLTYILYFFKWKAPSLRRPSVDTVHHFMFSNFLAHVHQPLITWPCFWHWHSMPCLKHSYGRKTPVSARERSREFCIRLVILFQDHF